MSETARHKVHTALEESIGDENAGALMQMLPPYEWHEIATKADLASHKDLMVLHFKVIEQRFEANDQRHAEFMGKVEGLEGDVAELKTDVAELKTKVDRLETKVNGLETDVAGLKTDVAELKTKVDRLETKVDRLETKVDRLETKVDGLCETVDGLDARIGDVGDKYNNLSSSFANDMAHALHRHTLANTGIMIALLSLLVTALKLT